MENKRKFSSPKCGRGRLLVKEMKDDQLSEFKKGQICDEPKMWAYLRENMMKVGKNRRKMFWMILLEKTARVLFWTEGMVKDVYDLIIINDQLKAGDYMLQDDRLDSIMQKVKDMNSTNFGKFKKLLYGKNEAQRKRCEDFIKNLVKCFDE